MRSQHLGRLTDREEPDLDTQARQHLQGLERWRRRSLEEQWLALGGDDVPFSPGVEPARGRIRVGLFCPCLGLGGAEAWQLALADAIDPTSVIWRGAAVTEGKRSVAPAMLGQLAARMPVGYGWEAARRLAAVCDVIVSWSVLDHDLLFRGLDRPPRVALACHFPGEMPWTPAAEQLLSRVDRLVAVSELAVESLPPSLRDRAAVIWNAVDPARLIPTATREQTRAAWEVPQGAKVAGFLGRLAPEKDPDAMLRLAEHLPASWSVVLVGEGRDAAPLQQKATQMGLDRVRFVGGTDQVGNALAAFDILVVPSRFESFGLTMAEGFWAGIPVVATQVGLAKLVPGLIRPVGFVSSGRAWAAAVQADAESAATCGRVRHAQRFARAHLDLKRFGRAWTDLIQELAEPQLGHRMGAASCHASPIA